MGDKVLYFPYIAVPEDVWFTQVLLYWDEIGTIVPRSVLDQPDLLGSYTAGLIRERLLSPIDPGRYLDQLPHSELVQEFLRVVEEDPVLRNLKDQLPDLRTDGREFERLPGTDVVPRRALGRSPPGTSFVHVDKAGHPLMDELVEKKLAQHVAGPEFDRWFLVEERTASLFMAYLASLLGAMEEVGMDPMTDEIRALNAFSSLGMGLPNEPVEAQGALAEADRLQLEIVRDILPAPLTPVDPADLADFKADSENVERRRKLRTMIEEAVLASTGLHPTIRARRLELLRGRLTVELESVRTAMRHRWGRLGLGTVLTLSPAVLPMAVAPHPATVGAGDPRTAGCSEDGRGRPPQTEAGHGLSPCLRRARWEAIRHRMKIVL